MMYLESTQDSPVDFDIIEFKRISKFITIRQLKAHQTKRNKEIETQPHAIEFGLYIERFIIELSILSEEIKKGLIPDQIAVF